MNVKMEMKKQTVNQMIVYINNVFIKLKMKFFQNKFVFRKNIQLKFILNQK